MLPLIGLRLMEHVLHVITQHINVHHVSKMEVEVSTVQLVTLHFILMQQDVWDALLNVQLAPAQLYVLPASIIHTILTQLIIVFFVILALLLG